MSGIENNALAAIGGDSFAIFSVDKGFLREDQIARMEIEETMSRHGIPFKHVSGCYAGKPEECYVIPAKHWHYIASHPAILRQESVLVLGPRVGRDGYRPATLHFLKPGVLPVALGYFVSCSEAYAKRQTAWTYDPGADASGYDAGYFVATFNPEEVTEGDEAAE
jgi:hypothetical protein